MSAFYIKRLPVLFLLLLAGLFAFRGRPADDVETLRHLVQSVQRFYTRARPETVYLHLDKGVYTAGETIWLRAYVADADQHQLDTLRSCLS